MVIPKDYQMVTQMEYLLMDFHLATQMVNLKVFLQMVILMGNHLEMLMDSQMGTRLEYLQTEIQMGNHSGFLTDFRLEIQTVNLKVFLQMVNRLDFRKAILKVILKDSHSVIPKGYWKDYRLDCRKENQMEMLKGS